MRGNKDNDDQKLEKSPVANIISKRFLDERKIFLWGSVEDKSCERITAKLLYLESVDPGKEIKFYINTPGGSVTAGMAVFDTIRMITSPVSIIVMGMAASMGAILLCASKKGNRYLFPHSRLLIHQPLIMGQVTGPAVDINILAEDMEKQREELNKILADATGQPLAKIKKDTDRDFYLNAEEAIKYGLADKIINSI